MSTRIEHLVVSGGANAGIVFFGLLKSLAQQQVYRLEDIQTMYATSVGTLLVVYLALQYDWQDVQTFILDRPWKQLYHIDFNTLKRAIQEGGLFGHRNIVETLRPMLLGKDLSLDITLAEFYAFSQKELHFFMTDYGEMELVDVSYKTHPHWKLVDAVYASCCLPILFDPFYFEGRYYVDGAVLKNYPLQECIHAGHDPDTILGVYCETLSDKDEMRTAPPYFSPESSTGYKFFDYALSFLMKLWTILKEYRGMTTSVHVLHEIPVSCDTHPMRMMETFASRESRYQLFESGMMQAEEYVQRNRNALGLL
jgi:predicted acylesterase/phospholipase RssA